VNHLLLLLILTATSPAPPAPQLPTDALRVPILRQATVYSCGAAALQAVLAYWDVYDGGESKLYGPLACTEADGTEPDSIVRVARQYGLTAELKENQMVKDLQEALAAGTTVILDMQAWRDRTKTPDWTKAWEDGHYVVLVGLDKDFVYLMDPSILGTYAFVTIPEFLDRWHDYEARHGKRREYQHAAIFVRGKSPRNHKLLLKME
jgi:predicted double-glycine peptidase